MFAKIWKQVGLYLLIYKVGLVLVLLVRMAKDIENSNDNNFLSVIITVFKFTLRYAI